MTITAVASTYQVLIAAAGATSMGTPDLTLALSDLADVPILSGPSVDVLKGTTVSHPFSVECIVDTPLFLSSGRLTEIGRLIEVQRADDGGSYSTLATGRISHVSEIERGKVVIEVSDERWVERKTEIFSTTDTVQLHPPGLASAWLTKPAAGTRTYTVAEVSGDAVRIKPNNEAEFSAVLHIPMALRQALVSDLAASQSNSASNSAGNFNNLRFRYDGADRTVIAFKQGFNFSLNTDQPVGPLGNLSPAASGLLTDAWVYISGHSLSPTDQITGRFYWPSGVEINELTPVHLGGSAGIHPFELAEDILNGDYGGQAVRFDATTMQALQDAPYKPVWARITEHADRSEWLAKNIYAPYGVAPLVGTDLNLRLTSLRLPQNLDPGTLDVLTAANASLPTWEHTSRELVNVLDFTSRYPRPLSPSGVRPDDWPVDDYETKPLRLPKFSHDNTSSLGEVERVVDTELILSTTSLWAGIPNQVANELAIELFDVFGDGAQLGEVTVPDDAGYEVGDFVILDHDTLKGFNPGTGARTGDRVVLLLAWRDWGPASITFTYMDMGPNSSPLAAPTVSIAQDGTDPDLVNVTISNLPAGATATIECTAAASPPSTYDQIKAGVGNETVSFRLAAASGTAYCRAYSTAPNRIRSAYATDSVALSSRAKILTADVVMASHVATVTWTVPSGTAGMRTRYALHTRGADPSFGSQTDYDATDGGFTITGVGPRQAVSVELTPYTGWTGSAVSGTAGDVVVVQAFQPRVTGGLDPRNFVFVTNAPEISFDADGETVVSVSGDEDVAAIYVTVGNGSAPSDPTAASNDGSVSDRQGTISTGVKITTGNDAYVKVRAADAGGNLGPVVSAQQARRIGPFHKDVSNPSVSGTTSETSIKTITVPAGVLGEDGMLTLRAFFNITGSAGAKTIRLYWGGTSEWLIAVAASVVSVNVEVVLFNTASDSAQGWLGTANRGADDVLIAGGSATIDTSADRDLEFTVELANAGDTVALPFVFSKFEGTD